MTLDFDFFDEDVSDFDTDEDEVNLADVIDNVEEFVDHLSEKVESLITEYFEIVPTEDQVGDFTSSILDILSIYVY